MREERAEVEADETTVADVTEPYGSGGFRNLKVWRKSKALAVAIYKICENGGLARDYGLKDQMCRAAVSICSNIAEGDERGSNKDSVRFLYIAKGSLAELRTQLEIAEEVGYLEANRVAQIERDCAEIGKMLGALIKARS
jgi:four helix bundle protein